MQGHDGHGRPVVLVVVGTRPEAIKLVPLILALRDSGRYRTLVVSTGQHHEMVEEVFGLADIRPDVDLWVGDARSALNERVSTVMRRFDDFCRGSFPGIGVRPPTRSELWGGRLPALALVHGDTSSAMGAALAAFHLRIPVVHVEAGLRTGGLNLSPFPEELNRQVISCIAAFHLAPTPKNEENLVRENISSSQIFVTGNTGVDALQWAAGLDVPFRDPRVGELHDTDARIVLVTAHRRENWGGGLAGIAEGVARLARSHPDTQFLVPRHPNPSVRAELSPPLEPLENVLLTETMRYTGMARMLRRCHFVITDSGGLQEEAPSLDKPVLVTRDTTERTEGVEAGTLRLVGCDPDRIEAQGARLLDDPRAYARMASAENPYGDGRAAQRIVAALLHVAEGGAGPSPFGTGYTRLAVLEAAGYEVDEASTEVPLPQRPVEDPVQYPQ
ncbi:MAG TPA: UDP-N-acetylglucosamine 2-epimerase (non-hydrolyzing) [Thermoleophilaceae bacterium]